MMEEEGEELRPGVLESTQPGKMLETSGNEGKDLEVGKM